MAKGYWIVRIDVTDAENYPDYVAAAGPVVESFGGRYMIRGGAYDGVEGVARARNVMVEFENYGGALECYNSPAYQEVAKLRQAYADTDFLIVEGV